MSLLAVGNPFITSYVESDWFGKGIFWGLFFLSALSWTLIINKGWVLYHVRKFSTEFSSLFSEKDPLSLQFVRSGKKAILEVPHPFFEMYIALKQKTLQVIGRNHFFANKTEAPVYLSEADLALIEAQGYTVLTNQMRKLEKNLFVLSTIATLGPFLGLLGTVWGILLTFSELPSANLGGGSSSMLAGLSMALATTVIGLVIAIPAFAGFTYLRNEIKEYRRDLENFSQILLSAIELQYRKPDYAKEIPDPV
jgi:biopolymer transport protein TolQ